MLGWIKALIPATIGVVPLLIKELTDVAQKWHSISAFWLVLLLYNRWLFKPDLRFQKVRTPALNAAFNVKFQEAREALPRGQRLGFRANVMQEVGWLDWKG